MERRGLTICYGDPEIAGSVAQTIQQTREMKRMKKTIDETKAALDFRSQANRTRLRAARREIATKYPIRQHGRLYHVVWGLWGLFWHTIFTVTGTRRY